MPRNFFAGANTPSGFFGHYENIIAFENINRKIYIKGGSGTGKSTLIKKTADYFFKKSGGNIYAELFYCSNDAESLDGVSFPELGVAAVDATSPHPADPQLPGAIDEIFNAADYLDKAYIKENKQILTELYLEKKALYNRAYGYLRAAAEIHKLNSGLYANALNKAALNQLIAELLRIFKDCKPTTAAADNRELFATAITPEGVKSFINSALDADKTYVLQGSGAMGITETLEILQKAANLSGCDTVSFKSPLEPAKIEHLYISMPDGGRDIAFTTSNKYHEHKRDEERDSSEIDFAELLDTAKMKQQGAQIKYNSEIFGELLQKCIGTMAASKELHLKVEEIYAEGMDFKRMSRGFYRFLEGE
ncbi:MAG: hypothetical protein FWH20_02220 [Oscillospiraceae bacterium]|nr:hypothetical protein [Oscillospiraceae bacterium]